VHEVVTRATPHVNVITGPSGSFLRYAIRSSNKSLGLRVLYIYSVSMSLLENINSGSGSSSLSEDLLRLLAVSKLLSNS